MKKKKLPKTILFIVITSIIILSSCEKEKVDSETNSKNTATTEVSIQDYESCVTCLLGRYACIWDNIISKDTVWVINNQIEFDELISCVEQTLPPIDFSKNSLVLVQGETGVVSILESKNLQQINSQNYLLTVNLHYTEKQMIWEWCIVFTCPKMDQNAQIELKINEYR